MRSIPAHAGKSIEGVGAVAAVWVHPRARGEIPTHAIVTPSMDGPSPRTRGNPGAAHREVEVSGSIPAHAGKSLRNQARDIIEEVHPRARGEIQHR